MWDYTALAVIGALIAYAVTTTAHKHLRRTAWTQPPAPRASRQSRDGST